VKESRAETVAIYLGIAYLVGVLIWLLV